MGTLERTTTRRLIRDIAAIATAVAAVGVSFGAIATAADLPFWLVSAMSVLVFAGGSQFMAVGLIAAGNPLAAVFAGLLLNARHLPFGLAIAGSVFGGSWPGRLVGSHLMVDESVAFAMAQPDPQARRRAYWLTGSTLFMAWNVGTLLGIALGGAAGDPGVLGLDAAFPAGLIALLLPSLRERETRRVALLGAAVAVLTTPLLPAGLPVLLALVGLAVLAVPIPSGRPEGLAASAGGCPEGLAASAGGCPEGLAASAGGCPEGPAASAGGRPERAAAPAREREAPC